MTAASPRADVYSRVTNRIIADLEQGVRPWLKPWNAEHAAGRITRPLRANGQPYKGINVLMLWGEAMAQGFASPVLDDLQASAGTRRAGRARASTARSSSMPTASRKTETGDNGDEIEREIPFMKGYTVFNCEQIDGLPEHFYAQSAPLALSAPLAHRRRRALRRRDRRRHPPWRQPGLLRDRRRPCADAALRELPRRRKLLRDLAA